MISASAQVINDVVRRAGCWSISFGCMKVNKIIQIDQESVMRMTVKHGRTHGRLRFFNAIDERQQRFSALQQKKCKSLSSWLGQLIRLFFSIANDTLSEIQKKFFGI
jgi:hypothetical protein